MASPDVSTQNPCVSIIVPVYNSAAYLKTLLDSLTNQTYRNLEIICVNDGSKDESLDILHDYAEHDDRIVVVDKDNSGAAQTRNVGLRYVHGEYLCFVDSDDYVAPQAFATLVAIAEENQTDAVIFDMDNFDDATGETSPTLAVTPGSIPTRSVFAASDVPNFYKRVVGFTVNKLYRSSFLLGIELEFPSVGAHEDMPFTYIALSAARRLYYLDETFYYYRRAREGSLSDGTNDDYRYMMSALVAFEDGLKQRGLWKSCERNFVNYCLHMCHWKYTTINKFRRWAMGGALRKSLFAWFDISSHDAGYYFDQDDFRFYEHVAHPSLSYRLGSWACRVLQDIERGFRR